MSFDFKISKTTTKNVVVLNLLGSLVNEQDMLNLQNDLEDVFQIRMVKLMIDLSELSLINSSGLNLLIKIFTKIRNNGGDVAFVKGLPQVIKILELSKLNSIFTICANEKEALNFLNAQEA